MIRQVLATKLPHSYQRKFIWDRFYGYRVMFFEVKHLSVTLRKYQEDLATYLMQKTAQIPLPEGIIEVMALDSQHYFYIRYQPSNITEEGVINWLQVTLNFS